MTDLERIRQLLEKISGSIDPVDLSELQTLVAKSQNAPPYGDADGSVNESDWLCVRDVTQAFDHGWRGAKRFLR